MTTSVNQGTTKNFFPMCVGVLSWISNRTPGAFTQKIQYNYFISKILNFFSKVILFQHLKNPLLICLCLRNHLNVICEPCWKKPGQSQNLRPIHLQNVSSHYDTSSMLSPFMHPIWLSKNSGCYQITAFL